MKKVQFSIISILLAIFLILTFFLPNSISYADELTPETYGQPGDTTGGQIDESFVKRFGGDISSIGFGIAIVVSIVAVTFVGLKYITGGITQRSEYKKELIPMLVGAGIIVFLSTILSIIARAAASI